LNLAVASRNAPIAIAGTRALTKASAGTNKEYALGLARAFGGALIFSLPLLMTMEMWSLGFTLDRTRLLLFLALDILLLVGLSRFGGFEKTSTVFEDVLDAFAAIAIGAIASALVLWMFGVLTPGLPIGEIVGKVAVQTVPASFGAMIARKQLGGGGADAADVEDDEASEVRRAGYGGQLFLMLAGSLFLAFNVAPTEEMILIAYKMTPWQGIVLMIFSILILHGFVYAIGFAGQEERTADSGFWRTFLSYTVAGYGVAVVAALYVLWTFGRTDGAYVGEIALATAVLAFPAAVGAAIARLVI